MSEPGIAGLMSAGMTNRANKRYKRDFMPLERDAIKSVGDKTLLNLALERVRDPSVLARADERKERDMARYGVTEETNLSADVGERRAGLNAALYTTDTMNNAQLEQYTRNQGLREQLLGIGRGVSTEAQGLMQGAATSEQQRTLQQEQAETASKAGMIGTVGQVGGIALTAVFA